MLCCTAFVRRVRRGLGPLVFACAVGLACTTAHPRGTASATAGTTQPGTSQARGITAAIATPARPAEIPPSAGSTAAAARATNQAPPCSPAGDSPGFTAAQIRRAYGVDSLAAAGIDGTGQSVVIVVSFGNPVIADDLAAFSTAMCLPPTDLQELYPLGMDFSRSSRGQIGGWRAETTLDAEWIHAIAPKARIIVLVSPVAETEGVVGLPEFLALEQYALDNRLGNVISQSWGTSENLLDDADGEAIRAQFDRFYQQATAGGVTIVTASGDHGALGDNPDESTASVRAAAWPTSSPLVTAVGGTVLSLNDNGGYGSERALGGDGAASGSGVSVFYTQPSEQSVLPAAIQTRLNGNRGEADVAAVGANLTIRFSAGPSGTPISRAIGGTSASAPVWAGIVALAGQAAGMGLGNINPALYTLGAAGRCFHDVTAGSNAFQGDPGEPALPGWDFPTGWGSPDAACLIPALAAIAKGG